MNVDEEGSFLGTVKRVIARNKQFKMIVCVKNDVQYIQYKANYAFDAFLSFDLTLTPVQSGKSCGNAMLKF